VGHYDEEREKFASEEPDPSKPLTYIDYKFETSPAGLTFTDSDWPIQLRHLNIGDVFVLTLDGKDRTMFRKWNGKQLPPS
jgi:hypothetical protein